MTDNKLIVKVGRSGITRYYKALIKTIEENSNEFVSFARVNDGEENYSYIVLFKDKSTIGKYSALIQEWGTNDGISGEGGNGFKSMNKYLDDNEIKPFDFELTEDEAEKIGYSADTYLSNWEDRVPLWEKYVEIMVQATYL